MITTKIKTTGMGILFAWITFMHATAADLTVPPYATNRIDGAFGILLGSHPNLPGPPIGTNYCGYLYAVVPPTKNEDFVKYYVNVTPTSKALCAIIAFQKNDPKTQRERIKVARAVLTEKYGKTTREMEPNETYEWLKGDRKIELGDRGITQTSPGSFLDLGYPISYSDTKLLEQGRRELKQIADDALKAKVNKADKTGL